MAIPQTSVACISTSEAAQRFAWQPGKGRNLHGHSYRLDVTEAGPLDDNGVGIDFDELPDIVGRGVIAQWDHSDVNTLIENLTAQLLAHRAWEPLTDAGLVLDGLHLWETVHAPVESTAGTVH